ncbi:MAG: toll/interleukin-1 receptor domain-containing protein [Gemmatimonadetes bacterium]|nr:toll/interleukin-1 receptor domain-containing protein [Gemmatimonadota bacterium]
MLASTQRFTYVLHDVFICHASQDKDAVVRPLARELVANHVAVWYDEFELLLGDSLREKIDGGLSESRYGIVVLSPAFFARRWPQSELDGLFARESMEGERVILPIWHGVDAATVAAYSPFSQGVSRLQLRRVLTTCLMRSYERCARGPVRSSLRGMCSGNTV